MSIIDAITLVALALIMLAELGLWVLRIRANRRQERQVSLLRGDLAVLIRRTRQ